MTDTAPLSEHDGASSGRRTPIEALRGATFGAILALLVEYGLGMWVNIDGHLPAADRQKGLFDAFGRAVANGPVGLSIHAILGIGLGVMTIAAIARAASVRRRLPTVMGVIALISIVGAAVDGAGFVGSRTAGASLGMAISSGVAILAYVISLYSLSGA